MEARNILHWRKERPRPLFKEIRLIRVKSLARGIRSFIIIVIDMNGIRVHVIGNTQNLLFTCTCTGWKFVQNFISSRDGPDKVQKQGRDERMQEHYPTSAVHFLQCRVAILSIFSAIISWPLFLAKFQFLLLLLSNNVITGHCKFMLALLIIVILCSCRCFRGGLLLDVSAQSELSSGALSSCVLSTLPHFFQVPHYLKWSFAHTFP